MTVQSVYAWICRAPWEIVRRNAYAVCRCVFCMCQQEGIPYDLGVFPTNKLPCFWLAYILCTSIRIKVSFQSSTMATVWFIIDAQNTQNIVVCLEFFQETFIPFAGEMAVQSTPDTIPWLPLYLCLSFIFVYWTLMPDAGWYMRWWPLPPSTTVVAIRNAHTSH